MSVRKSRGGRPRKSVDVRDAVISCRLTAEEFNYLNDLALNEGLLLNDLLRLLLLAGMPEKSHI